LAFVFLLIWLAKGRELSALTKNRALDEQEDAEGQVSDRPQLVLSQAAFPPVDTSIARPHLASPLLDDEEIGTSAPPLIQETKPKRFSILNALFVIAAISLLGLGVYKIKANLDAFQLGADALSWPSTSGVVTDSIVRQYDTYGYDKTNQTTTTFSTFKPEISYSYKVDGDQYESSTFSVGTRVNQHYGDSSFCCAVASHYPTASKVKVYYNPKNPAMSVLQPGFEADSFPLDGFVEIFIALWFIPLLLYDFSWAESHRSDIPMPIFGVIAIGGLLAMFWFLHWAVPKFLLPENASIHFDQRLHVYRRDIGDGVLLPQGAAADHSLHHGDQSKSSGHTR
jgi:hypothetical protein